MNDTTDTHLQRKLSKVTADSPISGVWLEPSEMKIDKINSNFKDGRIHNGHDDKQSVLYVDCPVSSVQPTQESIFFPGKFSVQSMYDSMDQESSKGGIRGKSNECFDDMKR